jgi:selenocysteine lyase/cysteine desulfurase
MSALETWFEGFRREIVGVDQAFRTPFGEQRLLYADWTASGRLYAPIERQMVERFGPFVANTHSESNTSGTTMTLAYREAHRLIKQHVRAAADDVIITQGSGMTGVVNKLQRLLGLRIPEQLQPYCSIPPACRPVVFVTHMEHHSNQTSWEETICDVEVVPPDERGLVSPAALEPLLDEHRDRPLKIGAFTACSNVTGIRTPYHDLARVMHAHGGLCFVDFAASGPYVEIDMHPPGDPAAHLDAIYFSPHKFLGGPGTPGVLVFNSRLYSNRVPDQPGGGTVLWTNPWHQHTFIGDIEIREDGGTPAFLQTVKAALAIGLKDAMGVERMLAREHELVGRVMDGLSAVPRLHVLAGHVRDRLGIFSFYLEHLHYNLVVRLLNDRFGIQVRGGCSCAGTYGHFLLHVDPNRSRAITEKIDHGDLSDKPGWVRMSIHPTTPDREVEYLIEAVDAVARHGEQWAADYTYSAHTNEFCHRSLPEVDETAIRRWFEVGAPTLSRTYITAVGGAGSSAAPAFDSGTNTR